MKIPRAPHTKSCGCLIASNVISLEIARRKKTQKLLALQNKLKKTKSKKKRNLLSQKKQHVSAQLALAVLSKKSMKKRFEKLGVSKR